MWVWGKRVRRMRDPWSQRREGSLPVRHSLREMMAFAGTLATADPGDLLFSKPDRLEGSFSQRTRNTRSRRARPRALPYLELIIS
jgi:hypothetical protein